jgi:hypothetical protein
MKKWVLFVTVYLILFSGNSQIFYEDRIEFELKDGYSNEQINLFGENGFIISSKKEKIEDDLQEWKFEKFTSDLQSDKVVNIVQHKKLISRGTYINKEQIFNIYKDSRGNFNFFTIDASTMEVTKVTGRFPAKFYISEIIAIGDYAFIRGTMKKNPMIAVLNWKTSEYKIVPISIKNIAPKKTIIQNMQVLEGSDEVFVFVNVKINKKQSESYVIQFSENGTQGNLINVTPKNGMNLRDISASKLDEQKYIFTGTYSSNNAPASEGVFFCQTENNGVDFINFYKYSDLKNFLNYLPKRQHDKINKKRAKKEKKGEEFILNYRLATHEILPLEDGFLFLGEAFYPTYRTQTYTTTSYVNGRPTTTVHTQTVFDGYQYTHAMLCKFDFEGNMVWDQIFEMWGTYKPFYVKKFISIIGNNQDPIKLAYSSHHRLVTKTIDSDGKVVGLNLSLELKNNQKEDAARYTFSDIDYWFDNYFIAYGNQIFKNEDGNSIFNRKRKVYFINKIKFE